MGKVSRRKGFGAKAFLALCRAAKKGKTLDKKHPEKGGNCGGRYLLVNESGGGNKKKKAQTGHRVIQKSEVSSLLNTKKRERKRQIREIRDGRSKRVIAEVSTRPTTPGRPLEPIASSNSTDCWSLRNRSKMDARAGR